jgi:magnesium chelatase family protein
MVSSVYTVSFVGLKAEKVDVQVHIGEGLPAFFIVGLANKAVTESKERIRSAFIHMGLSLPTKRITINLSPADLIKEGSHYDLPIALGLLVEMEVIAQEEIENYIVLGEVSLNSAINKVTGVLPTAVWTNSNDKGLICPYDNSTEAAWSGNKSIIAPKNIFEVVNHFTGKQEIPKTTIKEHSISLKNYPDLKDIKGQKIAKRALEIAAAGGHNMIMTGPPGSGKSMLAKRLPSIIPAMTNGEVLEVSVIASIAGTLDENGLITNRPFRAPHCTASLYSMIGGGKSAKPGEITLSHLGILFLDELPEFQRNVLESLRQPIEDRVVTISRVNNHITYPANFQLIAAMNPCKCGYFGYEDLQCNRIPKCAQDYKNRVSGPLLDRFDIQIEVPEVNTIELKTMEDGESSETVLSRVVKARHIQQTRYKNLNISTNRELEGQELNKHISYDEKSKKILHAAMLKFRFSMRGMNTVLKVARTIADLESSENITHMHITEALSYRVRNSKSKY